MSCIYLYSLVFHLQPSVREFSLLLEENRQLKEENKKLKQQNITKVKNTYIMHRALQNSEYVCACDNACLRSRSFPSALSVLSSSGHHWCSGGAKRAD